MSEYSRIHIKENLRILKLKSVFNNNEYRRIVSNYIKDKYTLDIPESSDHFFNSSGDYFVTRLQNLDLDENTLINIFKNCNIYDALELFCRAPMRIIKQPENIIKVKKGDTLKLQFEVFGLPWPRFRWYKKNSESNIKISSNSDGILILENFCPEDQGWYYCEATQIIDNDDHDDSTESDDSTNSDDMADGKETKMISIIVKIEIYSELKINFKPSENICKYEGESLFLEVNAEGYPEPQYKWTFKEEVFESNKIEKSTCTIEDSGTYYCEIWNSDVNHYKFEVNLQINKTSYPICKESVAEKIALLIGNVQYQNYDKLETPLEDLDLLEVELKKLNFLVIKKFDLNLSQMNETIKDLCNLLKNEKNIYVFIYYAGHGFEMGDKYLMPIDVPDELNISFKNCISEHQILRDISLRNPKLLVFILDMCLSLPKDKSAVIYKKKPDNIDYEPSRNVIRAYSTSSRLNAYEFKNKGYCKALIKYIGQNLPISEIIVNVELAVVEDIDKLKKSHIKQEPSHLLKIINNFYLNVPKTGYINI